MEFGLKGPMQINTNIALPQVLLRCLAVTISASCLVSCGSGSGSGTPPVLEASCQENVCQLSPANNTPGAYQWNVGGQTINSNGATLDVLFSTSGIHDLSLTDMSNGLAATQQVDIPPVSEYYSEAQISLQMVLLYDHTARYVNNFITAMVPQIDTGMLHNTGSITPNMGTLSCAKGGLVYDDLRTGFITNESVQPGDTVLLSGVSNSQSSCSYATGQPAIGVAGGSGMGSFVYETPLSGVNMDVCLASNLSDAPDWAAFGIALSIAYQGTNGSILSLTGNIPTCSIGGEWLVTPSDVPPGDSEGSIGIYEINDFHMTTDAQDSAAISGGFTWILLDDVAGEQVGPRMTVNITKPLDIENTATGLRMAAGAVTLNYYVDDTHFINNMPDHQITLSAPAGGDTSSLQVSVQDFTHGGGTVTGTYPQADTVSLPHSCAANENPIYCIGGLFFYLDGGLIVVP